MRLIEKVILAGALLLGSAQMASAGVLQQQDTYGPAGTKWSTTLDFAGFNSSLGTLNSVTVTVEELLTGSGSALNESANTESGTISITDTGTVSFLPGTLLPLVAADEASTSTLTVGAGKSVGPVAVANTSTVSETTASDLTPFESAWTGHATDTSSIAANFGTANVLFGGTSLGEIIATVTYGYSAPTAAQVSEPFSIAMLASGLLSLGLIRRRRSR